MKARDYAAQYKENPTGEQAATIAIAMCQEVKEIAEKRRVHSNAAIIAVLKEQIKKWQAFARLVDDPKSNIVVEPDGLKKFILKEFDFIPAHLL